MDIKWLAQLRNQRSLSQKDVAEAIGIDRSYYTKIENGLTPSVKVAKEIARYYGFDWTVFFDQNCVKSEQKSTA